MTWKMNELTSAQRVARQFDVSEATVRDKRWRARVGLPTVKVGRLLRFRVIDVERLIADRLEPTATRVVEDDHSVSSI